MMLCYLREEIDAPPGDEPELLNKAIEAGSKLIDYLNISYASGDADLGMPGSYCAQITLTQL
jgi:hypothetical protein